MQYDTLESKELKPIKVGSKQIVRSGLIINQNYCGAVFSEEMKPFSGNDVEIVSIVINSGIIRIKEDGGSHAWTAEMFE